MLYPYVLPLKQWDTNNHPTPMQVDNSTAQIIQSNWHEFPLDQRPSKIKTICNLLGSRKQKPPNRLCHQTPPRLPSHCNVPSFSFLFKPNTLIMLSFHNCCKCVIETPNCALCAPCAHLDNQQIVTVITILPVMPTPTEHGIQTHSNHTWLFIFTTATSNREKSQLLIIYTRTSFTNNYLFTPSVKYIMI